jgi:DNA-binding Lrp family transcriptional regulator
MLGQATVRVQPIMQENDGVSKNYVVIKLYRAVAERLRSFANKTEMNAHVRAHVTLAGRKLNRNAKAVLDVLAKHSCVISGVSWLNTDTIAKKIGVCERTVRNIMKRLEALRIGQRKTVEVNGTELRFFVLNRFELEIYPEFSSDVSTQESEENPVISTVQAHFISNETKETKEIHKKIDNDKKNLSIEEQFIHIANEEGLQEKDRTEVLSRLYEFKNSIGSVAAYIRKTIQNAIAGKQKKQPKRSQKQVRKQANNPVIPATPLNFEDAVKAQLSRGKNDKRCDKIPDSIIMQMKKQQVQNQSTADDTGSYEKTLLRIQALLSHQLQE